MKTFKFTFLDRQGNELLCKEVECFSKREAIYLAKAYASESRLANLYEIKTRKID